MAMIRRREPETGLARGFDPFETMRELMQWEPLRDLARTGWGQEMGGFIPSFEVKETKDTYVFKADLPGIKEEDLDVSLTGNRLTVSGERKDERRDEGDRYFTYERSYGSFSRSFTLPDDTDADNLEAELKDGVLTVVVAKKAGAQPKRISLKRLAKGEAKKA